MTERYTYDRLPAEPVRARTIEWLRFHGIDPHIVCVPGWIERDPDQYAVRALTHDYGPIQFGWDGGQFVAEQRLPTRVVVEQRSEGPPLPWPVTLTEWLDGPAYGLIRYPARRVEVVS